MDNKRQVGILKRRCLAPKMGLWRLKTRLWALQKVAQTLKRRIWCWKRGFRKLQMRIWKLKMRVGAENEMLDPRNGP